MSDRESNQNFEKDMEAKVSARAEALQSKIVKEIQPASNENKISKEFIFECLKRNRVGDAALFLRTF